MVTILWVEIGVEGYSTRLILATMNANIQEYVKKSENRQKFVYFTWSASIDMTLFLNLVPYAQWGLDIIGAIQLVSAQRK